MPRTYKITEVNNFSAEECQNIFKNIVECYPEAAVFVCQQRPLKNLNHILQTTDKYLEELSAEEKEEVLKLHPDLAGKLADEGKLTTESLKEQQSAGLSDISDAEKKTLNNLNEEYKNKFGFPFVICARENKFTSILNGLKNRLKNSKEDELTIGIEEVKKICKLRVQEITNSKS